MEEKFYPLLLKPGTPGGIYQLSLSHPDAKKYLWVGYIIHVDVETMVCSVGFNTSPDEKLDIPLPAMGGGGPRSFSGTIPEKGATVICGWKPMGPGSNSHFPFILSILSAGVYNSRDYAPFLPAPPEQIDEVLSLRPDLEFDPKLQTNTVRLKLRKAYSGDFLASASSGSDILLDRNVVITNRSGNEFILRDSDQTAVLQTINEFTANAAGYYRRGLIKRNAFSFLSDYFPLNEQTNGTNPFDIEEGELFKQKIPVTSPVYDILFQYGLIDEDGVRTFSFTEGMLEYPYIVTSDGRRINYVYPGSAESGYNNVEEAYIEDRRELRHVSDGVMPVTDEGDGFFSDESKREVFIEDVHGTVVGNNFVTNEGRALYKKVLKMQLFSDSDQGELCNYPTFESIDNATDLGVLDSHALARLYRIQSPTTNNQWVFGINKEGRTFLHIPASQTGLPDDKGKSLDLNIMGLVKGIIGKDPNTGLSLDLRLKGGMNFELGTSSASGNNFNFTGPITVNYLGGTSVDDSPTVSHIVDGSTSRVISGSDFKYTKGTNVRVSGGLDATEADGVSVVASSGGYKLSSGGEHGVTVLGASNEYYAQDKSSKFALGKRNLTLAGVDSSTVLTGNASRTVVAGNITDSVVTGNITKSTVLGNIILATAAGAIGITNGLGALALAASAGPISLSSTTAVTLTGLVTAITSPVTSIGIAKVGVAVAGIPGPNAPHLDYLTGIPILGIPTIAVG